MNVWHTPHPLPLQAAAERLWRIRWLLRERAFDPRSASTALVQLRIHPSRRVAALAIETDDLTRAGAA
jgi:hypothetical protein